MARIDAVAPDLMFASRIEATLSAAGHEVRIVDEADAVAPDAALLIADLSRVEPESVARVEIPVLAFLSHLDAATRKRAEAAGIEMVVPRSRMAREMPELVARLLGG